MNPLPYCEILAHLFIDQANENLGKTRQLIKQLINFDLRAIIYIHNWPCTYIYRYIYIHKIYIQIYIHRYIYI